MLYLPPDNMIQPLICDLFEQRQVSVSILRLDKVHPIVSGNKLFKLHFFLQNALLDKQEGIVTFGGAYSNHLVATAFACSQAGLKSAAFVRGVQPKKLSHTLMACVEYGMQLHFLERKEYDQKTQPSFVGEIQAAYKNFHIVPEGGFHPLGATGAGLIMDLIDPTTTHICCAVGTATTVAGICMHLKAHQQMVAIPVLKNMTDLNQRIGFLTNLTFSSIQLTILQDYHFGGYAKKTPELIKFMNGCFEKYTLPTDFVYTGKMMFGVIDSIQKNFFPPGSKIACIHTGGLQGNLSLPPGSLVF